MKRFCAVFLSSLLISLFLVGAPEVSAQEVVALSLQPATLVVAPESEFTVTVILNSGQKPIDSAQVTLAFDPARLSVLSLTPGTALPDIFQQGHDNSQGRILYAAGKMLGGLPKGQLEVFKAQFRAVSAGAGLIEFAADLPMSTKVASGGQTLALELAACQVTISSGSAIVATPDKRAYPDTTAFCHDSAHAGGAGQHPSADHRAHRISWPTHGHARGAGGDANRSICCDAHCAAFAFFYGHSFANQSAVAGRDRCAQKRGYTDASASDALASACCDRRCPVADGAAPGGGHNAHQ